MSSANSDMLIALLMIWLPFLCGVAGVALLIFSWWRHRKGLRCKAALILGVLALLVPVSLVVLILAGLTSGVLPVPT